ncbi:TPA: hypothetical protein I7676_22280, partial [Vibrio vulnificus]|nr:hypothetical protein [Vibrio vulnificus]
KLKTPPPHHQSSFPCTRESIHPRTPDVAFGHVLAAIGSNIEQPNSNTDNEAVIPSFNTRRTMDPRVREDDVRRDRTRLTDRSCKEEVGITKD